MTRFQVQQRLAQLNNLEVDVENVLAEEIKVDQIEGNLWYCYNNGLAFTIDANGNVEWETEEASEGMESQLM